MERLLLATHFFKQSFVPKKNEGYKSICESLKWEAGSLYSLCFCFVIFAIILISYYSFETYCHTSKACLCQYKQQNITRNSFIDLYHVKRFKMVFPLNSVNPTQTILLITVGHLKVFPCLLHHGHILFITLYCQIPSYYDSKTLQYFAKDIPHNSMIYGTSHYNSISFIVKNYM